MIAGGRVTGDRYALRPHHGGGSARTRPIPPQAARALQKRNGEARSCEERHDHDYVQGAQVRVAPVER
jgi:hypothetical protein